MLAVVVLNFVLVHAAPGDPVETIAGASGGMSPEMMAQLRTQYGLDKPLLAQLGVYLGKVLSGDLGYSYFFNLPVQRADPRAGAGDAAARAQRGAARLLLGTTLGVLSARKPERPALAGRSPC